MRKNFLQRRIFVLVLILTFATLACQLFTSEPSPDESTVATLSAKTDLATATTPAEKIPEQAPDVEEPQSESEEPTEEPVIELEDIYRSTEGGYAFRPITDYSLDEFFGFTTMMATDGSPDSGPAIIMIGEVTDEELTLDEFYDIQIAEISSEDVIYSDPRDVIVGGKPGRSVDISGTSDGVEVAGIMTVVLVNPTQTLLFAGVAPVDQWDDFSPVVDAVESSITFFEPQVDTGFSEEAELPDVPLGDEYTSVDGGYTFRGVEIYEVDEIFGSTTMLAPGGDPDTGPGIYMVGEVLDQEITLDELYDAQIAEISSDEMKLSTPRNEKVGGMPARTVDINGTIDEVAVAGRITVVLVDPKQMFLMGGLAPADQWEDFYPVLEAVKSSVSFDNLWSDELRQWATTAIASSSYGDPDWHATQAAGAPDTIIEECEDLTTAWASAGSDTVEWIELSYEIPVVPTEINIIQTHSPDQVVKVELLDTIDTYHQVYSAEPVDRWEQCPFTLSIPVEADYEAVSVKITIDQSVIPTTWNEIDAVELVGVPMDEGIAPTQESVDPGKPEDALYLQDPPVPSEETYNVNLQLMELDYEICEPTDFFTAQTEIAVKRFQEVNGLEVDGVVGPETWEHLFGDDAVPATLPQVGDVPAYMAPSPVGGGAIARDGEHLWVLSPGFTSLEAFKIGPVVGQEYAGIYSLQTLTGEEEYRPQTMTYDGTSMWVAFLGDDDAILQAYDTDVSPVEGVLTPQLAESIHIEDVLAINGLIFDGSKLWLAFEGISFPSGLVPVDPETGEVGQLIGFGMEAYVKTPAFDGEKLWVPVDGYYGGDAIRSVDPVSGELGELLGVCGTHVVYDTTMLWVAKEGELWVVDPYNGESIIRVPLEVGQVRSMIFSGAGVWVLDWDGVLQYFRVW